MTVWKRMAQEKSEETAKITEKRSCYRILSCYLQLLSGGSSMCFLHLYHDMGKLLLTFAKDLVHISLEKEMFILLCVRFALSLYHKNE